MNISYETKKYTELTALSGTYPNGVKFPQIYLRRGHNRNHIGGFLELKEYLEPSYDFIGLKVIAKQLTRNLNHIIDHNYYPTPETKTSNLRHRPIGIGVQGLANVFFEFGYPFDSEEAKDLNEDIFETIYYGAMEESMELAKEREVPMKRYQLWRNQVAGPSGETGDFVSSDEIKSLKDKLGPIIDEEINRDEYLGSYSSFIGSPLHQGKFQFDLWQHKMTDLRFNWSSLKNDIQKYGVRNSLLVAPMPTASTAQILGNYECFEPIMSNIYTRRVLSGEYMVINDYLVQDLISLGKWSPELKDKIIANDGSCRGIPEIPDYLQAIYKTVWETKQKNIIDMAVDRGKFICQSQSMNLFLESPNVGTMSSMHSYSWKKGLKTGVYYLRSRPSSKAIQFTLNPNECENCSG